jgi:hypothetical protein
MRHFNAAITYEAETPEGETIDLIIKGLISGPIRSGRRGHIDNWTPDEGGELDDIEYYMTDSKGKQSRELTGKEITLLQLESPGTSDTIHSRLYEAYCADAYEAEAAYGDYLYDCMKDEEALKD